MKIKNLVKLHPGFWLFLYFLAATSTCCDVLTVAAPNILSGTLSGTYTRRSTQYNNKPVYENQDQGNCIFYLDHWKVDDCAFVGTGENTINGYVWSKLNPVCPGEIGLNWRYIDYSGPYDGGPVDSSIVINCKPGRSFIDSILLFYLSQIVIALN